jgi:hypothetical protein
VAGLYKEKKSLFNVSETMKANTPQKDNGRVAKNKIRAIDN